MSAQNVRDGLRATIMNSPKMKPRSVIVNFMGADVELRQPKLGESLALGQLETEDRALYMLIAYVYVPGTDEKLFEEGDIDMLREMPANEEFTALMNAVASLSDIEMQVKAAKGN